MQVELKKLPKRSKRTGRGVGSGKGGHTVGYGQKGQGSRGRRKVAAGLEGGNIPLYRKIPKLKGFKSLRLPVFEIQLGRLDKIVKEGDIVNSVLLSKNFSSKAKGGFKIIGGGDISKAITVTGIKMTASVKVSIEKAGGKIIE